MTRRLWAASALFIVGAMAAAVPLEYVPGQVLVKFRPGYSPDVTLASLGARSLGSIPDIGVTKVQLGAGSNVLSAVEGFRRLGSVQYAEPNVIQHFALSPNDTLYPQQYAPQLMRMPATWDFGLGTSDVTVAVIDTGVDYTHEDLIGRVVKGHDYVNNDNDPFDDNGHGTHCAGIAAASTNNGKGVAGMAGGVTILAIKTLSAGGSGSLSSSAEAVIEATNSGASVISMSYGSYFQLNSEADALAYAASKGVVLVGGAGNDGTTTKFYPAAYEQVIAVGSTDSEDKRSGFSNQGSDWVDVAAPGSAILSTFPKSLASSGYLVESGTSMSTPTVAGLAGLVISRAGKGSLTGTEVRALIEGNTVYVGNWVKTGRIDPLNAVDKAQPPVIATTNPTAFAARPGYGYSGTLNDIITADGSLYRINSIAGASNNLAEGSGKFRTYANPSTLRQLRVIVRAQSRSAGSGMVFLRDRTTSTWVMVKSFPLGSGLTTQSAAISGNLSRFIAPTGDISFRLRATLASRISTASYTFGIDSIKLETTNRGNTP